MKEYYCSREKLPVKRINPHKKRYCKDPIQIETSDYLIEN